MALISERRTFDLPPREKSGPQLLVSVRSPEEAICAVEGGADILDIKEPSRGSLGMAEVGVLQEIAARVRDDELKTPLSVALGEVLDWADCIDVPGLPAGITFAKLGPSNMAGNRDWRADWHRVRNRFDSPLHSRLKWVAVAYADDDVARSPGANEILSAAIESRCAGLLVDTYSKTGRSLMDFVDAAQLAALADRCHAAGLFLALAGSLRINHLSKLCGIAADVIAIRSAGCRNADRGSPIDASNVKAFRTAMEQSFDRQVNPPW